MLNRTVLLAALLGLVAMPTRGADPGIAARVVGITARLQSADFAVREAATLELEQLPAAALPLMERLMASGDLSPEVTERIGAKLDLLRRGAAASVYEAQIRAEWKWNRDSALGAYDRGKHLHPKWNLLAKEAIVLHTRPRFTPNLTARDRERILVALRAALDAGCDDPLVTAFYVSRYRSEPGFDRPGALKLIDRAVSMMTLEGLPPDRRAAALIERAWARNDAEADNQGNLSPGALRDVRADLAAALHCLPAMAADMQTPRAVIYDLAKEVMQGLLAFPAEGDAMLPHSPDVLVKRASRYDPQPVFDRVAAALRGLKRPAHYPLLFEAQFHLDRAAALGARIDGAPRYDRDDKDAAVEVARWAEQLRAALNKVPPHLAKAHTAEPGDPVAATLMLECLAQALHRNVNPLAGTTPVTAAECEIWFSRAMSAYPNNLRACQLKAWFLLSSGAREDALTFSRACAANYSHQSRIPFVLVDTHFALAPVVPDAYFARDGVWGEVALVYDRYLTLYPRADRDRSMYAKLAADSGRWPIAHQQFTALGDKASIEVFGSEANLGYLKKKAARNSPPASPP